MRAATGKTCDSAHNPTDPGKISLALRTFVHVPPSAFADFERKIVTALFVRNPEVAACKTPLIYPVAVGVVAAMLGVPLAPTMHAFLHALISNWISAASRLVPLGQTDSQRVLVTLEAAAVATANRALTASLDDLGSATFRADLASLRHETQYTRLFRS